MSDNFDVQTVHVLLPGTLGDGVPAPLFHNPANAGAITILEAQFTVGSIVEAGTAFLYYGTLSGAGGTVEMDVTLGTSFGTGGGTFVAVAPVSLDLVTSPCIVPADKWLSFAVGTLGDQNYGVVNVTYTRGK